MKYRVRKNISGRYEVYYLKYQGNGYSREYVSIHSTRGEAQRKADMLNGWEVKDNGQYNT